VQVVILVQSRRSLWSLFIAIPPLNEEYIEHELEQIVTKIYLERVE
jgi:hypothetical protein